MNQQELTQIEEELKAFSKLESLIKVVLETDCLDISDVHYYENIEENSTHVDNAWASLGLNGKIAPALQRIHALIEDVKQLRLENNTFRGIIGIGKVEE